MADWTLHPFLAVEDTAKPHLWYVLSDNDQEMEGDKALRAGLSPRLGQSCVVVDHELMFFGGANPTGVMDTVAIYNPLTLSWRDDVICSGKAPSPRYDHAGVFLTSANILCVFGGATESGNLNDVHFLDLSTRTWTRPAVTGKAPCARTLHSAAHTETQLIVFGGGGNGPVSVPDTAVHVLDAVARTWTTYASRGAAPSARQSHTMTTVGRRVYVYGGMDSGVFFGDVYVWDLDTHEWSCPDVAGTVPPSRASHAATAVGTLLYVYGGLGLVGGAPAALVDLWVLDTTAMAWAPVAVAGPPVGPRMDFTMCAAALPPGTPGTATASEPPAPAPAAGDSTAPAAGARKGSAPTATVDDHGAPVLQDITVMFGANGVPLGAEGDGGAGDAAESLAALPVPVEPSPAAAATTSSVLAAALPAAPPVVAPVVAAPDASNPASVDAAARSVGAAASPAGPLALLVFGGVSLEGVPYGDLVAVVP